MTSNSPARIEEKANESLTFASNGSPTGSFNILSAAGPWQFFKLTGRRRSRESLPEPPLGMEWLQNDVTFEWRLVKSTEVTTHSNDNTSSATSTTGLQGITEDKNDAFSPNTSNTVHRSSEFDPCFNFSPKPLVETNDPTKSLITTQQITPGTQDCFTGTMGSFKEPEVTVTASITERVLKLVSPDRPMFASQYDTTTIFPYAIQQQYDTHSPMRKPELCNEIASDALNIPTLSDDSPNASLRMRIGVTNSNKLEPPVLNISSYCDGSNIPPPLHPRTTGAPRKDTTIRSFASSPTNPTLVITDEIPDNFIESFGIYQGTNNNACRTNRHRLSPKNDDEWEVLSADLQENESLQSSDSYYSSNSNSSKRNQRDSTHSTNTWNTAIMINKKVDIDQRSTDRNSINTDKLILQSTMQQQIQSTKHVTTTTAGSVRSIDEADDSSWLVETSEPGDCIDNTSKEQKSNRSIPYKIQRTNSNSTIDSNDIGGIGGRGSLSFSSQKALLVPAPSSSSAIVSDGGDKSYGTVGVDFVYHVVLPTDTLQGICLAYKISTTRLRQANHFSGSSLVLAPKKLVVPISKQAQRQGYIRIQDTDTTEYKIHAFLAEFKDFDRAEAKSYVLRLLSVVYFVPVSIFIYV
jgi:hypothetical protein